MPPTRAVTVTAIDQENIPIESAEYIAQLDRADIAIDGVILPFESKTVTDSIGQATLNLISNLDGTAGSQYRIRLIHPDTSRAEIDQLVTVPQANVDLRDILDVPPPASSGALDATVRVSNADTLKKFLSDALSGGNAFNLVIQTPGANEILEIQDGKVITLIDGVNISTDCSLGNIFDVVTAGNQIFDDPTNQRNGATYTWRINQDPTGGRSHTFGPAFRFVNAIAPTFTGTPNARTILIGMSDGTNIDITNVSDEF